MSKREPLSTIAQPVPELPVEDVERAQRYYRDVLGFEIGWLDPDKDIGAVSRGEVAIFFRRTKPPFTPAVHWVFAEDVDASYSELRSSGANIVEPLEKKRKTSPCPPLRKLSRLAVARTRPRRVPGAIG